MVTETFKKFKLVSMEAHMFVNIFGVGFPGRVGSHGDDDVFTIHAGFNGADMFANIFGVGVHRRVGGYGDGDVF